MERYANWAVIREREITLYNRKPRYSPAFEDLYIDPRIKILDSGVLEFNGIEVGVEMSVKGVLGLSEEWKETGKGKEVSITFGNGWTLKEFR